MEQLKKMKTKLVDCVEKQITGNLEYANAEELGEAVDMIKDLSEAIYYCTITEAMEDKESQKGGSHYPAAHYYGEQSMLREYPTEYPMYMDYPIMYASGGQSGGGNQGGGRGGQGGGSRNYTPMMYASDGNAQSMGESRNYTPMMYASGNSGGGASSYMYHSPEYMYPPMQPEQDPRNGRSPMMRRRYMDGKKYNDKQSQMQELEKYAQELAGDLTEMIKDASPEEKTLLQQKISMLASKIK